MNITNGTEIDSVMSWLAKTINVESVSRILATLIVIIGTVYAMFPKVSYYLRVRQAAKVLSRAPLKFTRKLPDFVLPRQDVMSSLHGGLNDPDFNTVLVYGERGSGKTTAIEWNLRKRLGVFQWTVLATEGPAATVELEDKWIRIFRQWMKPEDSDFELDVCSYIVDSRENPLVVVISIDSDADPSVLRSVLHFGKKYAYNTQRVRMIVDISSSPIAVAMQTDLTKLRISGVFVGGVTQPEVNSLLENRLPRTWTDPMKQVVALAISEQFDFVLLPLIEVCKGLVEGMSADDALAHVSSTYQKLYKKARHRLEDFDIKIKRELNAIPDGTKPPPPNLLQISPNGLSQAGMRELTRLIGFPAVASIVSEVGSPHIFSIDPFTESISLNGRIMKKAFIDHYSALGRA